MKKDKKQSYIEKRIDRLVNNYKISKKTGISKYIQRRKKRTTGKSIRNT